MDRISSASLVFIALFVTGSLYLADGSREEVTTEHSNITSIHVTQSALTAVVHSTAILTCNLPNIGESEVAWVRLDNMEVLTLGNVSYAVDLRFQAKKKFLTGDWVLLIQSAKIKDSGVYECFVTSERTNRHWVRLTIVEPETKIVGEPTRSVMEGDSVNLTCVIEPIPTWHNDIVWTRDDGDIINRLPHSKRITTVEERGDSVRSTLLINNIRLTDTGNYTCALSKDKGLATVRIQVSQGRPEVGIDETQPSTSEVAVSNVESGSTSEVATEGSSRRNEKRKLDEFETEETRGLTLTEVQRLVMLKQLQVLAVQEDASKLQIEVLHLEKEKLVSMRDQRLKQTESRGILKLL